MLRRKRENSLWISKLQVINVKSFADSGLLQLSKGINVIVGKNNAGKSTLLQCVLTVQSTNQSHPFNQAKEARRIGTSESTIRITLQDIGEAYFNMQGISEGGQGDLTIAFNSDALPRAFTFTPVGTDGAEIPDVKPIPTGCATR